MDQNMQRNSIFDVAKGIAVILMVVANSAPVFIHEMPLIMRIFFSMAAPIFVMMLGFMVAYIRDKHNYGYFLLKALFILILAALVDIFANKIKPFEGFDVLYLIGFSIPIIALCVRFSPKVLAGLIIFLIATGTILRSYLGYAKLPVMTDIDFQQFDILPQTLPLKNWLLDGWFPILPWLGFMLIGVFICKLYKQNTNIFFFSDRSVLLINFTLFFIGLISWIALPSEMYIRYGYAELFYPAGFGVSLTLISGGLIILAYAEYAKRI